jgi:hypothetical protein
MATKKLNNDMTIAASLKQQAILLNNEMLHASNELIDGTAATSEKWQALTGTIVRKGLKMFAKQQDLILTTLETAKGQFDASTKRFNKLVGNTPKKAKRKAVEMEEEMDNNPTIDSILGTTAPTVKKAITGTKKKPMVATA